LSTFDSLFLYSDYLCLIRFIIAVIDATVTGVVVVYRAGQVISSSMLVIESLPLCHTVFNYRLGHVGGVQSIFDPGAV